MLTPRRHPPHFAVAIAASLAISLFAGSLATFADDSATTDFTPADSTTTDPEVTAPPPSLLDPAPKPKSIAICGDCGKEINADAKKCPHCGVELTDAYEAPPELLAPSNLVVDDAANGNTGSAAGIESGGSASSTPGIRVANQPGTVGTAGNVGNVGNVGNGDGEAGSGNAIVDFLKSFKGITLMTGLCMLFFFWKLNS